jgi:hypothetical protein
LAIKGRSENPEIVQRINKALTCKLFRCLPSQLDKEDAKLIEEFQFILGIVGEKNPFIML